MDLYIVSYSCWAAARLFSHKPVEKPVGKARSPNPKHQFAIALRVDYHFDQQKMRVSQGFKQPIGVFHMDELTQARNITNHISCFFFLWATGTIVLEYSSTPAIQRSSPHFRWSTS